MQKQDLKSKMNKVIVYGDIHGCLEEFQNLRKQIQPAKDDKEIIIGDILDRGPYSIELLNYIIENNINSILGNHEYKYIRYKKHQERYLEKGKKNPIILDDQQSEIYKSLTDAHFSYLYSLPFFMKIDNLTLIHAGITNTINLDSASIKELEKTLWIRQLDKNQKVVSLHDISDTTKNWSDYYNGDQGFIVYGHQVFEDIKRDKYSIGIDTGCVYGNKLTTLIITDTKTPFESYEVISVDAKKEYAINTYIA